MLTESDVRVIADRVLGVILGPWGFEGAEVEARRNHADEDAFFVTAHFKPDSGLATGDAYVEAISTLRETLEEKGESRFPYLSFDYPDEEAPFDRDEIPAEA